MSATHVPSTQGRSGVLPRSKRRFRTHRNRFEIVALILELSKKGIKKTHIMYRANLSYDQLMEYLSYVLDEGLLQKSVVNEPNPVQLYTTTPKGLLFLEKFDILNQVADPRIN